MATPTDHPTPPAKKPKRVQLNLRLRPETQFVLETVFQRDGVAYTEQIVRALRLWAKEKNVEVPHATRPEGRE